MSIKAHDQETMLRKKRTIGDWFLGFCVLTLALMVGVKVYNDNTLNKALTAFEKMSTQQKTTP